MSHITEKIILIPSDNLKPRYSVRNSAYSARHNQMAFLLSLPSSGYWDPRYHLTNNKIEQFFS